MSLIPSPTAIRQTGSGNSYLPRSRSHLKWWSQTGSNRRPHACKARALPTELWPHLNEDAQPGAVVDLSSSAPGSHQVGVTRYEKGVVGPGRLELPTSRLSGVCSNQLSYRPEAGCAIAPQPLLERLQCLRKEKRRRRRSAPVWCLRRTNRSRSPWRSILRKEVIQPQVPLRLPCYDFTPVADPTVVDCLLAVSASPSGKTNSHGVTGGVYKARERIHRGMLIRDY
jgi:hypothetical protein